MKIQSIKIDGFRNLDAVSLKLSDRTALIAENNFGKSNILDAITFGVRFIQATPAEKTGMMSMVENVPIHKELAGRNFSFEVELLHEETSDTEPKSDSGKLVRYSYSFKWADRRDQQPEILTEKLEVKSLEPHSKLRNIIVRNNESCKYRSSGSGRCSVTARPSENELLVNRLNHMDVPADEPIIIEKLNNLKIYSEDHLDVRSFYRLDPIQLGNQSDWLVDMENLPRILAQIQEKNEIQFSYVEDIFKNLFPSTKKLILKKYNLNGLSDSVKTPDESLPFTVNDVLYQLYVEDENLIGPIKFERLSDGAKRVLVILTKIIVAVRSNASLIMIEEPEDSVHPELLNEYLRAIAGLQENCKILFTTHSPYLAEYLEKEQLRIGYSETCGTAGFYSLSKKGLRILKEDADNFDQTQGEHIFYLLHDRNFDMRTILEM